jgi:Abnormal spindle-like microcephaly-assoc'd, ASPM-SPD-2-Hydin
VTLTAGSGSVTTSFALQLNAVPTNPITPVFNAFSCTTANIMGGSTDSCTVFLNAPASGNTAVTLTSDNSAVSVPASVVIPAGATSAGFTALVSAVTSAQTVALTANALGTSQAFTLHLAAFTANLDLSNLDVTFGDVNVDGGVVTQPLILTSSGTAPVTISSISVTGPWFSVSGATFPLVLNPGQTVMLSIQFDPKSSGTSTGQLTLNTNSTTSSKKTIKLTGNAIPQIRQLSCVSSAITGSATDDCSVTLNAVAASNGLAIALASSMRAVTLPASVIVPAGATGQSFTASVSPVSTTQTAMLTASTSSSSKNYSLQLNAAAPTLAVSTTSLTFGNVSVNTPATQSLTLSSTGTSAVTVSAAAVTGAGFTVSGSTFPLTLNPGQTATLTAQFNPTTAGAMSGQLTLSSNSSTGTSSVISLSGTGVPVLTGLICVNGSMSGAGTDSCTVTLNAAAASGGFAVNLGSNNSAVTVPASVTVPAGFTSAVFAATATAVTTAQTAVLTASAGTAAQTFTIQLGSTVPTLGISSGSLAFGNVAVNSPTTQSLTLFSTGTASVTVSAASVVGTGFIVSGASFPLTLNPGQTATLTVQFNPTAAGSATGQLTLTSNSSSGTSSIISLSGTGVLVLSALTCTSGSMTGSGSDSCTVTLNAVAPAGGFAVNLSSNNSSATLPVTVTVPAGATTAGFTAAVSAVSTAQTATLTASAGSTSKNFALQLNPSQTLTISNANIAFGSLAVSTTATQSLTLSSTGSVAVTVSAVSVTGTGFTVSGATFPFTLNPGQTATITIQFSPTVAGAVNGQLTLTSNSSSGTSSTVSLSGTGVPVLSGLSCTSGTITGSGTDSCTVSLNTAAATGGFVVGLASNNSVVTVPASVTIPRGSASVAFTANVASVLTAQSATLTASVGGTAKTFVLQLNAGTSTLSINATSISFGNVSLNVPTTQSLTLTSTGTAPVTISAITVAGTGFTISASSLPITLNPNQSATLSVVFNPTASGAATGQLTIASNSSSGASAVISLTGTGVSYQVTLAWNAPVGSPVAVAGYSVFRANLGSSSYQLLNTSIVPQSTFIDSTVITGQSYNYMVESVDASGNASSPSNIASMVIP